MNVSKPLTSALVATAIVGAIGLAYAQTSETPRPSAAPDTAGQPMQNSPPPMQNQPALDTSTSPTRNDTAVMPIERPARADRN